MKGIALVGFMGAGKSTVGRSLAARLGLPFADADEILAARHGPIPEQFARDGEAAFRERERAVVAELCDGVARVIATGGGAWADEASRRRLGDAHRIVWLDAPLDVLADRVGRTGGRPLWTADVAGLYERRRPVYALADLRVDTSALAPEAVADVVARWFRSGGRAPAAPGSLGSSVTVALGDRSYDVVLAPDREGLDDALRSRVRASRAVMITDDTVAPLWADAFVAALPSFRVSRVVLPAGEAHKTVATWARAVDEVLAAGVDRRTPVLALGGGVVGDVAGFVAATVLRGLPFVQLPTTSLAMIDSSVGGKTAVDHPLGKNLVGAFHQPSLVWAALDTLGTLPGEELRAGLAEAVKTAALGDAALFGRMERDADALAAGDVTALTEVIARCVAIKADIVGRDEREDGPRAVLNLGHTIAHGLETALGHGAIRHGEAVAIGLVAEARYAARIGACADPSFPDRLARLLARIGLPTALPTVRAEAVLAAMRVDKKAAQGKVRLPVCDRVGSAVVIDLDAAALAELLPESG